MFVFSHGDVWWNPRDRIGDPGSRRICGPNDLIGICGDTDSCILHKIGEFNDVTRWADKTRAKLAAVGDIGVELASQVVVLGIPATEKTLEVVNRHFGIIDSFERLKSDLEGLDISHDHSALREDVMRFQKEDREAIANRADRRPSF